MRNKREIKDFYVFYRISDNSYKNKDRADYITKSNCLRNCLQVFSKAKIRVYVDAVTEETDKKIHELCDLRDNVEVIYIDTRSNPLSFRRVYEDALKLDDNDFVYFLEDDYIHLKDSYDVLVNFAEWNYTDYVTLYDHPDKYDNHKLINPFCRNFGEMSYVFKTDNHHWKTTNSTTMTFGAFVDVIKRDKDVFWKYTSTKVSKDFNIFIDLKKEGKLLSSPIPSLSTHGEIIHLAPFIDWGKEVPQNKCCVLFITHKEKLSESEQRSLEQMIKVFEGKRDIFLLVPNTISLDFYSQYADHVNIGYIEHKHTESYLAYNAMLCSDWFYEKFKMYEYMLIYQSDCWVFEDKLDMFMDLGYDYYGAPWPHYKDKVGNGGFSLRKISAMFNVASKYEYDPKEKKNEDTWFCLTHGDELNICPTNIGCNFAIERMSNKYKQLIKTRPMGLHGEKMMKYWNTDGYDIKK